MLTAPQGPVLARTRGDDTFGLAQLTVLSGRRTVSLMRVWILGAGTLGVFVADHLRREFHDVVIIERDHAVAGEAARRVDCNVEIYDGTNLAALRKLSINTADCFIAVTGSDEVNMVSCGLVSHAFGIPLKIARVRNPHYAVGISGEPELFGIDHVINPEMETASTILRALEYGAVGQVTAFSSTSYSLRDIQVTSGGGLDGVEISRLRRECSHPFIAPVLARDRDYIIVDGSTRLEAGDALYLFSAPEAYDEILARDGGTRPARRKRTLILGGSLIGVTVAQALCGNGVADGPQQGVWGRLLRQLQHQIAGHVTIVEPSERRCEELQHLVPGAEIIRADIRDEKGLTEADYRRHDIVIGASRNEEANIVGSLHAKAAGVKHAAAVLYHDGYSRIARNLGVDVPVSLKNTMANAIASHLRGQQVKALHTIPGSTVSIIELEITDGSPMTNAPLRDLKLPKPTLILALAREGTQIIPGGHDTLQPGDTVIVLTTRAHESALITRLCPGCRFDAIRPN